MLRMSPEMALIKDRAFETRRKRVLGKIALAYLSGRVNNLADGIRLVNRAEKVRNLKAPV